MDKRTVYEKSKIFLDNFSLNFENLQNELKDLMATIFSYRKIEKNLSISFDESKLFGKSGSVSSSNISFNKTRIEMLLNFKIDSLDSKHIENIEKFYNDYSKKGKHTEQEEILYTFIKNIKDEHAEQFFPMMGSYKTIKYEILDVILHECEHVFQDEHKKYLTAKEFPNDLKSILLIFTTCFNTMYEKIKKVKLPFEYKRENHIFPIEFDARYISFKMLSEIKDMFFKNDKIFDEYIKSSIIIPNEFDCQKAAEKLFTDYDQLYKIFKENFSDDYSAVNNFIQKNKLILIEEFTNRFDEMQSTQNKINPANERHTSL